MATVRVPVTSEVLGWAVNRSRDHEALHSAFPKLDEWLSGDIRPTVKQLRQLASRTGVPFGYLLLSRPPALTLPVPDFREGPEGLGEPSPDLLAVVHLSIRRQDWYRDYAIDNDLPEVPVVGAGADQAPIAVAANMREVLNFEVEQRRGTWSDTRKSLLKAFEALGGLTVATSMVENNTHRPLDDNEFRGFSLVDALAPLVFVNTHQTLNGQIFTLAHEFAHVWRGVSGISLEDVAWEPQGEVESWCNAVASEFLVPQRDLVSAYRGIAKLELVEQLDRLARRYRCGTLVVLQAMHRLELRRFADFDAAYQAEVHRLSGFTQDSDSSGGSFLNSQPFRIGERFSRAVINDTLSGRTRISEALQLTSLKSLSNFDNYATHLGLG